MPDQNYLESRELIDQEKAHMTTERLVCLIGLSIRQQDAIFPMARTFCLHHRQPSPPIAGKCSITGGHITAVSHATGTLKLIDIKRKRSWLGR
jgi:hypothetical protein